MSLIPRMLYAYHESWALVQFPPNVTVCQRRCGGPRAFLMHSSCHSCAACTLPVCFNSQLCQVVCQCRSVRRTHPTVRAAGVVECLGVHQAMARLSVRIETDLTGILGTAIAGRGEGRLIQCAWSSGSAPSDSPSEYSGRSYATFRRLRALFRPVAVRLATVPPPL